MMLKWFNVVFCLVVYITLFAPAFSKQVSLSPQPVTTTATTTIPTTTIPTTATPPLADFDLSVYNETDPATHILYSYVTLTKGDNDIFVQNGPSDVGFFIVQVHSFMHTVTLKNHSDLIPHSYVNGTNIGLVQFRDPSVDGFKYYISYTDGSSTTTTALVVITMYDEDDPVPGGCNLSFDVEDAPYQIVTNLGDLVYVDSQAASVRKHMCEENIVDFEIYNVYLKERDLSSETYYDGIQQMLTVEDIRRNGWRVNNKHNGYFQLRTYYSAYPGTGAVYAIIAVFKGRASAYVPAVSYSCDVNRWFEDCIKPVSVYWRVFCAIVFFWGFFICFYGHRFFKLLMFTSGYVFGGFITYMAAISRNTTTDNENFLLTISFGFIYGVFWVIIWWRCGKPLLSMTLPLLLNGALIASLIFYFGIGDFQIFQNDINFWVVFSFIIFCYALLQVGSIVYGSFLSSSMLGSFAVIMATDHYVGSNLRYILINTIRRATVGNFNLAVIHPPLQIRDIILYCVWCFLTVSGVFCQWYQHKGKPPFPPPSFFNRPAGRSPSERTPLITEAPPLYTETAVQHRS